MSGIGDRIEVLRFWEEFELLTPPDWREPDGSDGSGMRLDYRSGAPVVTRRAGGAKPAEPPEWIASRLDAPFEYPEALPAAEFRERIPCCTVAVGIVPKALAYDRITGAFRAASAARSGRTARASDPRLPPGAPAFDPAFGTGFGSAASGGVTGRTLLAVLTLNPWGKYVDGSLTVAGFVGAVSLLRREAEGGARPAGADASEREFAAAALLETERIERRLERALLERLGQTEEPVGALFRETPVFGGDAGEIVRLSDPHPEAAAVGPETLEWLSGLAAEPADLGNAGAAGSFSVTLLKRHPRDRRLPDPPALLTSFYLGDLMQARMQLAGAGAAPFDAPDFRRLAGVEGAEGTEAPEGARTVAVTDPELVAEGDAMRPIGAPLARLLALGVGGNPPRTDLLRTPAALADLLTPENLPSGRWPADPGHHLYLCQQAAVAGILRAGAGFGPLVSVNGPPGTGKSWLVRDIVAEIVTRRARRIAALDAPDAVFSPEGEETAFGTGPNRIVSFRPIAPEIAGDGLIVVASSNNAAIRNITDQLPRSYSLRPPVADPRTGVRPPFGYWRDCALAMLAVGAEAPAAQKRAPATRRRPTPEEQRAELMRRVPHPEEVWGLASATLGSRRNCRQFASSVLGSGRPLFSAHILRQLEDWADGCRIAGDRDLDAVWRRARDRFLALDAEVAARRARMCERARRAAPAAFSTPLADDPQQHKTSLWVDEEFERARSSLFEAALTLHAATFGARRDLASRGLRAAAAYLQASQPHFHSGSALRVFEFLSFLVPVLSTTLASVSRLFAQVGSSEIPWVLIDEAGQAMPQAAAGLLSRARCAVVLGDPQQLMPVVTMPEPLAEFLLARHPTVSPLWSPVRSSLQSLADGSMEAGTFIRDAVTKRDVWTGLPLRTHRRCASPMFEIANGLSYGGQMVQMTPRSEEGGFIASAWIDVVGRPPAAGRSEAPEPASGKGARRNPPDPKVVPEELEALRALLAGIERDASVPPGRIFVLSPFRAVAEAAAAAVRRLRPRRHEVTASTVHAFQGREADAVILVLGSVPGVGGRLQRRWAASPANLLNVAVTRARRGLVVIGDRGEWTVEPAFAILAEHLPVRPAADL